MAYRAESRAETKPGEPGFNALGEGHLRSFVAYACKVFGLRKRLESVQDGRQDPTISTYIVAAAVFFCGDNLCKPRPGELIARGGSGWVS